MCRKGIICLQYFCGWCRWLDYLGERLIWSSIFGSYLFMIYVPRLFKSFSFISSCAFISIISLLLNLCEFPFVNIELTLAWWKALKRIWIILWLFVILYHQWTFTIALILFGFNGCLSCHWVHTWFWLLRLCLDHDEGKGKGKGKHRGSSSSKRLDHLTFSISISISFSLIKSLIQIRPKGSCLWQYSSVTL